MNSLLPSNPADEGQQRYIFAFLLMEVPLLKQKLGVLVVPWGLGLQDAGPLIFPDSIGERKRMRVLP